MLATMCFVVEECVDSIIKRRAIDIIDDAFTISILSRENFEELFDKIDKYADFIIALHSNRIVGYAAIYANNMEKKEAFITLIGVDRDFQHQGIGQLLMLKCKEIAAKKGMKTIRLEVLYVDLGAQRFYRKMGFKEMELPASQNSLFFLMEI